MISRDDNNKYVLNFVLNGERLFSFKESESISSIFKVYEQLGTKSVANLAKLEVVMPDENSTKKSKAGEKLRIILVNDKGFKPDDVLVTEEGVILFDDANGWQFKLEDNDKELEDIAEFLKEEAIKDKKIKESWVEDFPGEYTIWSATDLVDLGNKYVGGGTQKQVPLVKIKTDAEGNLEVESLGDDNISKESAKIAQNTINTFKNTNKSLKDILTRIDKSLNHPDQFLSTELLRNVVDDPLELIASQSLVTLRDDLKAAANLKGATEQTIVDKFEELTGVDYYTLKISPKTFEYKDTLPIDYDLSAPGPAPHKHVNKETTGSEIYETILLLQGHDITHKNYYVPPNENPFIIKLKNLAEDLIEKVILKNDPKFYDKDTDFDDTAAKQGLQKIYDELDALSDKKGITEDEFLDGYSKITGVDYYTEKVVDKAKYEKLLSLQFPFKNPKNIFDYVPPKKNQYLKELEDYTDLLLEKVLLREDPDFYNFGASET